MEKLSTQELRQIIEMLAMAITADMPISMRNRIAGRLEELGRNLQADSPRPGTHCIALADLLRSLPTPPRH